MPGEGRYKVIVWGHGLRLLTWSVGRRSVGRSSVVGRSVGRSTFAGHIRASYSSYEDDIKTNRIPIPFSTIWQGQTIKISRLR